MNNPEMRSGYSQVIDNLQDVTVESTTTTTAELPIAIYREPRTGEDAMSNYNHIIELTLVKEDHPALNKVLEEFDFANSPISPLAVAATLQEKMVHYKGLGLSANQLGLEIRAFAMATNPVTVVFNPKIIDTSTEEVMMTEGCLSYPGLGVKIKRAAHVRVRFTKPDGQVTTEKFTGLTARIFLHEYDHMNGINFMSRAGKVARDMAFSKWKKLKKLRDARWNLGIR